MEIKDVCVARGFVSPSWINVPTGERMPFEMRHNMLSYDAANAMASAFGGDPSYIPSKIGFIYGIGKQPDLEVYTRSMSWSSVAGLENEKVGVQVVDFSYTPTLSTVDVYETTESGGSKKAEGYERNAVTFHAVSNSTGFGSGKYAYQAVLIGGTSENDYKVISRVSLDDNGAYKAKPEGFEIALDWTITFK